jgi:hypothetical protein
MSHESASLGTLELLWLTSDVAGLRTRLGEIGAHPVEGDRVSLPPVDLVLVQDEGPADRLIVGLSGAPVAAEPTAGSGLSLAALGWATVDAERAASEFGRPFLGEPLEDALLGARAQRLGAGGRLTLILLEPATEGPLAAALARNGEGPVCLYVASGTTAPAGVSLSPTAMGPGRVAWPSRTGPFVILLGG